jgi:hypothetical protein
MKGSLAADNALCANRSYLSLAESPEGPVYLRSVKAYIEREARNGLNAIRALISDVSPVLLPNGY